MTDDLDQLSEAAKSFESPKDINPKGFRGRRSSFWKSIPERSEVDLFIQTPVIPRVRNQNGWNACTSMALAGMIEARSKIRDGVDLSLDAGFIHNCLAGRTQPVQPVDAQFAAGLCKREGVLEGYSDAMPVSLPTCQKFDPRTRIVDFRLVKTLDNVATALERHGPILVDLFVPSATFFGHRDGQILSFPASPELPLLHSMLLIGLDFRDGLKLAVVQNSAGAGWGSNGRAKIQIGSGGLLSERLPLEVYV